MTHETAASRASEIAERVLAPAAAQNDKAGRFSTEAVNELGQAGLLGRMVPVESSEAGLGLRTFTAVTAALAEADASVAGPGARVFGARCRARGPCLGP